VSAEEGFAESADIGVDLVGCEHDGNAAEQEHQGCKAEKSQWRDVRSDVASLECFPGHDGAQIDEHGRVEQKVSDIWEMRVLDLLAEPAVASKAVASSESYKEIVRAKDAAYADAKNCEKQIKDDHTGGVNVTSTIGEAQESVEDSADDETNCNAQGALPENSDEEVLLDSSFGGGVNECVQSNVEETVEKGK